MVYKIHPGREIIVLSENELSNFDFSLHIAVTQLHTQPGVVEKLLEDTRDCVSEILKSDNKNDTPTVRTQQIPITFYFLFVYQAVIYGTNQKVPDKSLVCDMAKLYIGACYNTGIPSTTTVD
jgi:sphinganine-1-phosphate aldolase